MFSVGRSFMNNFGINAIWFKDIVSLDFVGYIYMAHTHARLMSLLTVTPLANSPAVVTWGCRAKVAAWHEYGSSTG